MPALLDPAANAAALAALYDDETRSAAGWSWRGTASGSGEYKYLALPVAARRRGAAAGALPALAPIANRWQQQLGLGASVPATLDAYLARCHAAGQQRPTPLILKYGPGDYNCLHQDLYGELVFPLQATVLLSAPGDDFTGGEFLLVEQRPRTPVEGRGGAAWPGRRGDVPGQSPAGRRHPRLLPRRRCATASAACIPAAASPSASSSTTRRSGYPAANTSFAIVAAVIAVGQPE